MKVRKPILSHPSTNKMYRDIATRFKQVMVQGAWQGRQEDSREEKAGLVHGDEGSGDL